jgi:hypothetical protein
LQIPEEVIVEEEDPPAEEEDPPVEEEDPPTDEEEQDMMTFCHVPVGKPSKPVTIVMPVKAYENSAHATDHDLDYLGICHIPKIEMEKIID